MPTRYKCPECDSVVLVPDKAAELISHDEQIGCGNKEDHEEGESLIMWEAIQ